MAGTSSAKRSKWDVRGDVIHIYTCGRRIAFKHYRSLVSDTAWMYIMKVSTGPVSTGYTMVTAVRIIQH